MVTRQALLSQHISCSRARLASAAALRYLFSSREHAALVHLARIAYIFAMDVGEGGERALEVVASRDVRGAVYNLTPFRGMLLAGVNSRVSLYKWAEAGGGVAPLVSAKYIL